MIKNIQYLRFLAALLVILAHANLQIYGVSAQITNMGGFGVDIFFIISGFIMPFILYGGLANKESKLQMSAGTFLARRIIRIWPMYLISVLMIVAVSAIIEFGIIKNPSTDLYYIFNGKNIDIKYLIETITFTHWSRPPILGAGWTLQYEFIFYTAIALLIFLKIKKFQSLEISLLGVFLLLCLVNASSPSAPAVLKTISNPIIFEFILGMMLYRLVSDGIIIGKKTSLAILILSFPLLAYINLNISFKIEPDLYRVLIYGPFALLIVWSALSLESYTRRIKSIEYLGDASYSLYLMHGIASPIFVFIWTKYGLEKIVNIWIYIVIYTAFCHSIGIFAYAKIEKPINAYLKKKTQPKKLEQLPV